MSVRKLLSRAAKVVAIIVGLIVAFIVITTVIALIIYPSEYVYRVLIWQGSDVDDYLNNFPKSPLTAAEEPYHFEESLETDRIASIFEQQSDIDDLDKFLEESDTQAFIIIHDGTVVYEQYFNGIQRDKPVTSYSVAKSFTSALIGIAIEEGYINDVNDPITDYIPELAERDSRFEDITIRHVLLMASGLEYKEMRFFVFSGDDALTSYYTDQRELVLENTNIQDPPVEYFQYNKYHPQILGMILERTTGVSVTEYTQQKLWDPLGMEYDGWWSLDSEESGFEKMEAGLNGRAIDFAKFGQLFLLDGNWNGVQVIPSEWVAESTQFDPALHNAAYYEDEFGEAIYDDGQGYYKYMWYGRFRDDTYDFFALGDHGQLIYVSPQKNLVIVRHGIEYGIPGSGLDWAELLYQFVTDY